MKITTKHHQRWSSSYSSASESSTCETLFDVGADNAALGDCNVTVACIGGGVEKKRAEGQGTVVRPGANRFVTRMYTQYDY